MVKAHPGSYGGGISVVGGGLAYALPADRWIGWAFVAVGVLIMIWGIRIDGEPWWRWRPRKRALAPVPAPPNRLIPFIALRQLAPAHGIPLPRFGPEQNNAYQLEGELRQAAVRGELRVEGRRYRGPVKDNDPLVPVPASHFEDYGFAHGLLNYDGPNDRSHTGTIRMAALGQAGVDGATFYDLHIAERGAVAVLDQLKGKLP